jgi:indole-3-glycerol phosphate synthase/phosphoribosylanthranilate isomerase
MNIRDRIAARRAERVAAEGHALGAEVPVTRQVPIVAFGRPPFLIAEIKRRSPSRGDIVARADPVGQAGAYHEQGVRSVSVLTEEDHFAGSLADLMAVKRAYPDLAVLRKDFLLDEEDLEVSYRAGADAVLLIASLLSEERLKRLAARAAVLGLAALVEVHSPEDAAKARTISPAFTGINARNLETFAIDPALPLKIRTCIDWPTALVYESGIFRTENAAVALSAGFAGILVGEALMKRPALCGDLLAAFSLNAPDFWGRLYARLADRSGPLVKICGITSREDAVAAITCGADMLGFIVAESPRRTDAAFIKSLTDLDVLKVAVVTAGPDAGVGTEVRDLLAGGYIQAVQFHGDEVPDRCFDGAFPYYKVLRIKDENDVKRITDYHSPRVLIEAFVPEMRGGTGRTIDPVLVARAGGKHPLWLAGGIGPDNVREIIRRFRPELIDASSRLETAPGKKSHDVLRKYFSEIAEAVHEA